MIGYKTADKRNDAFELQSASLKVERAGTTLTVSGHSVEVCTTATPKNYRFKFCCSSEGDGVAWQSEIESAAAGAATAPATTAKRPSLPAAGKSALRRSSASSSPPSRLNRRVSFEGDQQSAVAEAMPQEAMQQPKFVPSNVSRKKSFDATLQEQSDLETLARAPALDEEVVSHPAHMPSGSGRRRSIDAQLQMDSEAEERVRGAGEGQAMAAAKHVPSAVRKKSMDYKLQHASTAELQGRQENGRKLTARTADFLLNAMFEADEDGSHSAAQRGDQDSFEAFSDVLTRLEGLAGIPSTASASAAIASSLPNEVELARLDGLVLRLENLKVGGPSTVWPNKAQSATARRWVRKLSGISLRLRRCSGHAVPAWFELAMSPDVDDVDLLEAVVSARPFQHTLSLKAPPGCMFLLSPDQTECLAQVEDLEGFVG